MLPSSKKYLINAGFVPSAAAWILLACFMGGFVGIQVVSRFLHHYIPSHVELCDHDNDHKEEAPHIHDHGHGHDGHESRRNSHGHYGRSRPSSHGSQLDGSSKSKLSNSSVTEASPLLSENGTPMRPSLQINGSRRKSHKVKRDRSRSRGVDVRERRPSMMEVPARVMSFVKDTKTGCEEGGKCFGYSDPCGQECFKHIIKTPTTPTNTRRNRKHTSINLRSRFMALCSSDFEPSPRYAGAERLTESSEKSRHQHGAEPTMQR